MVGAVAWWPTTTPWSTARPPTAPGSAGTARTPTCCYRATAAGSCWGRSSPMPHSRPRPTGYPTGAAPAPGASTAAPPARSWRRAWWMPGAASPGCSRSTGRSRPSTGWRSATGSTAATTARRSARPTAGPIAPSRPRTRPPRRSPRSISWPCCRRPITSCSRGTAAGTSPAASRATYAATPWSCWATWPTPPTRRLLPRSGAACPTPTRSCAATPDGARRPAHHADRRRRPLGLRRAGGPGRCPGSGSGPHGAALSRCEDRSVSHLLVTNDFPPKLGGIQSYLWELWRRLDPDTFTVLTTRYEGAAAWDAGQPFRVERVHDRMLLPTPSLARRIDDLALETGARLVLLDPALPVGVVGPRLRLPYALVLHGAEVTVPGRLPGSHRLLGRTLRGASEVIAAGCYPAAEAERAAGRRLPITVVPPGVDPDRFRPLDPDEKAKARAHFDLPEDGRVVVSLSRLVPRKGMDVLIEAAARLAPRRPDLVVAIGGTG